MNKNRITNGLFLIIFGSIFLLMNLGYIDWDIINLAINMWPVILILIGINVIFKNQWVKWISIVCYALIVIAVYLYNPDLLASVSTVPYWV